MMTETTLATVSTGSATTLSIREALPGAITALAKSCKHEGADFLDNIEQMDALRVSQIWIAFSDYCEEDVDEFVRRVTEGDEELEEPL